jgi:hypothetical protein
MARTLKVLLNIGHDDQEQYGVPAASQDEVITVDEDVADKLVNVLKVAKDYSEAEEQKERERVRAFDEAAIERDLEERARRAEIEEAVKARISTARSAKVAPKNLTSKAAEKSEAESRRNPGT